MQLHKLLLLIVVIISTSCGRRSKTEIPATPRDTTITKENAFTHLQLDSQFVREYITTNPMPDTAKQLLVNFYNSRNYQYAWFDEKGLTEHASMVWNAYQRYKTYSRDTNEVYKNAALIFSADSTTHLNAEDIRTAELQFTQLFFNYAFSAYIGSVQPEELQWYIPRKKVNIVEALDSLLKGNSSTDWEPVHPQYRLLRTKLLEYYEIQKNGGWDTINLKENKLSKDTIIALQKRFGLTPNGTLNKATIEQINVPVEERIKQILINMERMRWVPQQPKGTWILANIPSFRLQVYNDDSVALEMKIVVGAAATKTVIFSDQLKNIVFAPYWNVPPSIVRNEILPAMKKNPNYLKKSNMEQTGTSGGLPVIRQKPGAGNALGQVKFLFPNNYNIYFHDTPAKSYFERTDRAFSHGCIRLGEPFNLAKYLLRNDSSWTDKKIKSAMSESKEKWVPLKPNVPVFITYFTAWVDPQGELQFRKDIYGHDQRMTEHLFKDGK